MGVTTAKKCNIHMIADGSYPISAKIENGTTPYTRKCCPECGSKNLRRRIKSHEWVCERCGWIGKTCREIVQTFPQEDRSR